MNPTCSVKIFTMIAGAAQGLIVMLAPAVLAGLPVSDGFVGTTLMVGEAMLPIGPGASLGHVGGPERAWHAGLTWRTSRLSREVIVLPAFMFITALWWLALRAGIDTPWLPLAAIALAAMLWCCTAMIHACLRFIQEWAQPLTLVNFTLIGHRHQGGPSRAGVDAHLGRLVHHARVLSRPHAGAVEAGEARIHRALPRAGAAPAEPVLPGGGGAAAPRGAPYQPACTSMWYSPHGHRANRSLSGLSLNADR